MSEPRKGRTGQSDVIDRSVKALIRRVPQAFFRLARVEVDPQTVRLEDTAINLAEFRADHVFIVGDESDPACWALHIEYQIQPDPRVLRDWFFKNASLTRQLERQVILIGVYLSRGRYATFPAAYTAAGGGLSNSYRFETIRLWEHADRILSGELADLAPLLVLCDDRPSEATLQVERKLILGPNVDPSVRADLLAIAVTVGTRYFARDVLEALFREELQMLKEASFVEEWLEQAREEAEARGLAQGMAQGMAQGTVEGEARGRAEAAQQILLRILEARIGELPKSVVARIRGEGPEWCEEMAVRALKANSLDELGL